MINKWGNPIEKEIRRRIKISVWAYAYEMKNDSLVSDQQFDDECDKIDIMIRTGNKKLDGFFRKNFDSFTGQWIYEHPELAGIKKIYKKHYEL